MPDLGFHTPFSESAERELLRTLLPTDLNTEQLAQISSQLRERALFSARVTNAEFLDKLQEQLTQLATGVSPGPGEYMNQPTARTELKDLLESIDYQPEPGKEGTIEDLSSDSRLNLILDTNERMAIGYGQYAEGQDRDIIDSWPAMELIRIYDRKEPRDWPQRWADAGGEFYEGDSDYPEGRMIARKDDSIWKEISRFDLPYPPFDFNSGMGLIDISRDEAIELGIITEDDTITPEPRKGFNDDLKVNPDIRSQALRDALLDDVGHAYEFDDEGSLVVKNRVALNSGDWDESKHPRAKDGKFGSGDGAAKKEEAPPINALAAKDPSSKTGYIDSLYLEGGHTKEEIHTLVMAKFPGSDHAATWSTVNARPTHLRKSGLEPKWEGGKGTGRRKPPGEEKKPEPPKQESPTPEPPTSELDRLKPDARPPKEIFPHREGNFPPQLTESLNRGIAVMAGIHPLPDGKCRVTAKDINKSMVAHGASISGVLAYCCQERPGAYEIAFNTKVHRSEDGDTNAMVHESGHMIDQEIGERNPNRTPSGFRDYWSNNLPSTDLGKAILASPTVTALKAQMDGIRTQSLGSTAITRKRLGELEYYADKAELFARAYEAYIAAKTTDAKHKETYKASARAYRGEWGGMTASRPWAAFTIEEGEKFIPHFDKLLGHNMHRLMRHE